MNREVATVTPKVYRLIVDNEELIEPVKKMVGLTHHITDAYFFNCLESLAREFPSGHNAPAKPKAEDNDDDLPELPEHVMSAMQLVRKRRHLTLDLHRLMGLWPAGVDGHPNILVVSLSSEPLGYVHSIPEALNFMVDASLQIRNGETSMLRQREGITIYDGMTDTYPFNSSQRITLR